MTNLTEPYKIVELVCSVQTLSFKDNLKLFCSVAFHDNIWTLVIVKCVSLATNVLGSDFMVGEKKSYASQNSRFKT